MDYFAGKIADKVVQYIKQPREQLQNGFKAVQKQAQTIPTGGSNKKTKKMKKGQQNHTRKNKK